MKMHTIVLANGDRIWIDEFDDYLVVRSSHEGRHILASDNRPQDGIKCWVDGARVKS